MSETSMDQDFPQGERSDVLDACPPRPRLTRRKRWGLVGWHLRIAFWHLWAIVWGR